MGTVFFVFTSWLLLVLRSEGRRIKGEARMELQSRFQERGSERHVASKEEARSPTEELVSRSLAAAAGGVAMATGAGVEAQVAAPAVAAATTVTTVQEAAQPQQGQEQGEEEPGAGAPATTRSGEADRDAPPQRVPSLPGQRPEREQAASEAGPDAASPVMWPGFPYQQPERELAVAEVAAAASSSAAAEEASEVESENSAAGADPAASSAADREQKASMSPLEAAATIDGQVARNLMVTWHSVVKQPVFPYVMALLGLLLAIFVGLLLWSPRVPKGPNRTWTNNMLRSTKLDFGAQADVRAAAPVPPLTEGEQHSCKIGQEWPDVTGS